MKKYIKFSIFFAIICFSLFFKNSPIAAADYSDEGIAFYAQTNSTGYATEGIAFYAYSTQTDQPTGLVPVYRFFNSSTGDHFYTTDNTTDYTTFGYQSEGNVFYAYDPNVAQPSGAAAIYRFFNATNNKHFYTASVDERNALLNNPSWGYMPEGIAFYANAQQVNGSIPVYRFYNSVSNDHFYTASESEKNSISQIPIYRFYNPSSGHHFFTAFESERSIVANTSKSGYIPEGITFYAYNSQIDGTSPIYRFYNANTGDHFFTASEDEKNSLINNPGFGYTFEGIVFYVKTTQSPGYNPVYRLYSSSQNDHFYTASKDEYDYLLSSNLGPEISVGLWNYSKSDIQNTSFKIDANKKYNIKDANGKILGQVAANTTTSVSYNDTKNQLTVTNGSLNKALAGTTITFDAADDNNSSLIFNTHRSNFMANDWRGNIDKYRGKIKVQYYRGADIINNSSTTVTQIWIDNILPLEQYVWGAAETSGTGNINHTEVMTTAYRTYGFWYIKYANKYSPLGFKIRSDSGSQNYGGYNWESNHPNVKIAAQNTRAIVASYGGDVALTPYSSWSDGRTRSWQEKWGSTDYPWCQSVSDPYGKNEAQSSGSHMVGLIANGSVNLASNYGWSWDKILHYYFSNISLPISY